MSTDSSILVGFSRTQEQKHLGNLIVSTSTPICKVINVKSNMPILTIGFNLFLLLILSFSTLITACILVKKNRRPASNKKNANNKKPKSKDPVMMKDLVGLRVSFRVWSKHDFKYDYSKTWLIFLWFLTLWELCLASENCVRELCLWELCLWELYLWELCLVTVEKQFIRKVPSYIQK